MLPFPIPFALCRNKTVVKNIDWRDKVSQEEVTAQGCSIKITSYCSPLSRLLCFYLQRNTNCLPRFPDPSLEEWGREMCAQQPTQNLSLPWAKQKSASESVSRVLGHICNQSKSPFAFLLVRFFSLSGLMMCVEIFNLLVRQPAVRFILVPWFYFAACWSLPGQSCAMWVACSAWAASRWQPHPLLNPGEWRNVSVSLGHWGLNLELIFHFPERERKHLVFHAVLVASVIHLL